VRAIATPVFPACTRTGCGTPWPPRRSTGACGWRPSPPCWLSGSQHQALAESFAAFVGHPAYTTDTLCADLRRFVFPRGQRRRRTLRRAGAVIPERDTAHRVLNKITRITPNRQLWADASVNPVERAQIIPLCVCGVTRLWRSVGRARVAYLRRCRACPCMKSSAAPLRSSATAARASLRAWGSARSDGARAGIGETIEPAGIGALRRWPAASPARQRAPRADRVRRRHPQRARDSRHRALRRAHRRGRRRSRQRLSRSSGRTESSPRAAPRPTPTASSATCAGSADAVNPNRPRPRS